MTGFKPSPWLPGRHAQTIFGTLFRAPPAVPLARERWELADGDFVDVDLLDGARATLVVLHGLEGSSSAHYVRGLLAEARARGLRGVALNFRGCSGETNRLVRSYHSGDTGDVRELVHRVRARWPDPILFAGCSLGGNVLVKYLGEEGAAAEVRAAAAISVPFDLALCARTLDGPGAMSFVYRTRFLRTLKRKSLEKAPRFPGGFDAGRLRAVSTLTGFDDVLTGPVHGFAGAVDYYARSSSGPYVSRVRVPLLLLSAEDDPFIPPESIPREAAAHNPAVTLEVHAHGGHLGFVEGPPWRPRFYGERRALEFLLAQL